MIEQKILLLLTLLLTCVSCATPEVTRTPTQKIDKLYTVGEGSNEANAIASFGYEKRTQQHDLRNPIPSNLYWEHGLSDNFSFLWFILPLGVKYQVIQNSENTLGFTSYLQLGPPETFYLSQITSAYFRRLLKSNLALEFMYDLQPVFRFKTAGIDFATSLNMGLLFQLNAEIAITPWVGAAFRSGDIGIYKNTTKSYFAPVGVDFDYQVWKNWSTEATIGRHAANFMSLGLKYVW